MRRLWMGGAGRYPNDAVVYLSSMRRLFPLYCRQNG